MKNGFSWGEITHVLLDLDGTLLDRDFDDAFWAETVPLEYARKKRISFETAQSKLMAAYTREEGTQNWFDIAFWSREFGLDINTLQAKEGTRIRALPGAVNFLETVRCMGKPIHLLTDAHPQTVEVKLKRVPLDRYFDSILSAFDVGCIKKERCFWEEAHRLIGFDPCSSMFIDDRPHVLESARQFGVAHIFHKAGASTSRPPEYLAEFFPVVDFSEILES